MENMKLKIDHFVIVTQDIQRCCSFYQRLGFKAVDCDVRYELYKDDFKINVHIQGKELHPNAYIAEPGTLDICFEINEDLEVCRKQFQGAGYDPTNIGCKSGVKGKMQSFYVRDPDQNLIELCSYT